MHAFTHVLRRRRRGNARAGDVQLLALHDYMFNYLRCATRHLPKEMMRVRVVPVGLRSEYAGLFGWTVRAARIWRLTTPRP